MPHQSRTHERREDAGSESAGDALQQLQLGAVAAARSLSETMQASARMSDGVVILRVVLRFGQHEALHRIELFARRQHWSQDKGKYRVKHGKARRHPVKEKESTES